MASKPFKDLVAQFKPQPTPQAHEQGHDPEVIVSFGVIKTPDGYQATKFIHYLAGLETRALHAPVAFESVAYEYLTTDVLGHYMSLQINRAHAKT